MFLKYIVILSQLQITSTIVFALGRATPIEFIGFDVNWLYHSTVVGGLITLSVLSFSYILKEPIPLRTVILNQLEFSFKISIFIAYQHLWDMYQYFQEALFVLIYSIMFFATGSCTIDKHNNRKQNPHVHEGLAMGSLAIITGFVLLIDLILLLKAIIRK